MTNAGLITGTGGTAIQFLSALEIPFTLHNGTNITGTANGGTNATFQLGGTTGTPTFNVSALGVQYTNFSTFNKINSGQWTLSGTGAQTWAVSGGTLTGATTSASGNKVMSNGANFAFDQAGNGTYSGVISGNGNLIKEGTGTVTVNTAQTYTGTTTINGGTLKAGSATAFPTTSAFTVAAPGAFDLGEFNNAIGSLAGSGTVTTSVAGFQTLTTNGNNSSTTFSGTIQSGSGIVSLVERAAYRALLRESTLTPVSRRSMRARCVWDRRQPFGQRGCGIEFSRHARPRQFNVAVGLLGGNGTVSTSVAGFQTLTVNNSSNTAFGGVIQNGSGIVTLAKQGIGTFTLTGANTHTGGTNITAGTLLLAGAGSLGASGGLTSVTGASAILNLGSTTQTQNVTLASGGTISSGALNGSITSTGGTIDNIGGGASATINGGTFFSGANTYTGATIVNAQASALNNNAFSAASLTTINAAGFLQLNGTQTINNVVLAGGTITGGVLNGYVTSTGGTIANTAGAMSLTANAGTTLMVSSGNAYTGATTINSGATVQGGAANSFSALSATTINTGGIANFGGFSQTIDNVALAGGTITNGALTGAIASTGGTVNGLGGTATLTTTSGTTNILGTNTFSGATTVNGGLLSVTGTMTSAITVNAGGTLGGTGIAGPTMINGGTLSPGNSIGTIQIAGNLQFVGPGNYVVEVSPSAADKTNVTGTANSRRHDPVRSGGGHLHDRHEVHRAERNRRRVGHVRDDDFHQQLWRHHPSDRRIRRQQRLSRARAELDLAVSDRRHTQPARCRRCDRSDLARRQRAAAVPRPVQPDRRAAPRGTRSIERRSAYLDGRRAARREPLCARRGARPVAAGFVRRQHTNGLALDGRSAGIRCRLAKRSRVPSLMRSRRS